MTDYHFHIYRNIITVYEKPETILAHIFPDKKANKVKKKDIILLVFGSSLFVCFHSRYQYLLKGHLAGFIAKGAYFTIQVLDKSLPVFTPDEGI